MAVEPNAPPPVTPRPRLGWLWIAILLLAGLAGFWHFAPSLTPLTAERAIGGPFALIDQHNHAVTDASLSGKPYALFFGYTHCPDECPTTLQDMSGWLAALGGDAAKLNMVFVTLDPARDTVPVMADYMKAFDGRILALTGNQADIDKAMSAFRIYAKKVNVKGTDYDMEHITAVYLMTGRGDFATLIGNEEKSGAAVAKLKDLIGGG